MAEPWQLKAVLSAVDKMTPVLKGVNTAARSTRKYLADIASAANGLTSKIGLPLTVISGIAAGFSVGAIKNAVVGFTDLGEAVQKGALKAGMSVEAYQRMKYVADQSGTSIEAMEGSLSKLNRQIGEAAAGKNKSLSGLMARLKVNVRDANGQIRAGIDILPQLADAFAKNENPAVRARMGMALFGKGYAEILPLLAEGSKGIAENLERFSRIKGVLGPDQIKAAKELGDSFKDLDLVTKGFQGTVAKELVPVIKPMVDGLTDWWIANKKLVGVEVGKMAKDLGQSIASIDFSQVLKGVSDFVQSMGRFIDMVGGGKNALIGLIVIMNLQTVAAVVSLVGALGRAGLAFLAMAAKAYLAGNASLLAMLRIAAVALFTAGPLGVLGAAFTWLAGVAAGAGGLISGALGAVGLAIRAVGVALMANPLGIILGLATAAYLIYKNWDTLKAWFSSFFDWIGEKFHALVGWAVDLARSVGNFFGGDSSPRAAANAGSALNSGGRPSLVAPAGQVKASGKIEVSFKDAPQGMRVEQARAGGDVPIDTSVGYRSYATGMP